MNLSKWDDVTFFSREQVAHLLAGIDPDGGPYAERTLKRIRHYRKLLSAAIDGAIKHAQKFAAEITEPPDFLAPDIFEYDAWGGELPSYELRCQVADVLTRPGIAKIVDTSDLGYTEKFIRDDIHFWILGKGLIKGYLFNASHQESIDRAEQETTDQVALESLELALESQLEALLQRYWEYADNLLGDRDVARLDRIGNWQRITMLDRMEEGEEFLSDCDRGLLVQIGSSGAIGYVLANDQGNQEWQSASYPERWIAFGVHAYCRIISGQAGTDEAIFLFRLASKIAGFLERGDPEEAHARALSEHARAAANARHSRPGGSRDKKMQIREIWMSGKYSSRDICAEQECAALGMSFSAARKALRGTPGPT